LFILHKEKGFQLVIFGQAEGSLNNMKEYNIFLDFIMTSFLYTMIYAISSKILSLLSNKGKLLNIIWKV